MEYAAVPPVEATLTVGGQQTRSVTRQGDWAQTVCEVTAGKLRLTLRVNWDGSGHLVRESDGRFEYQHTWERPLPPSNSPSAAAA
jgi:hypothetical protein